MVRLRAFGAYSVRIVDAAKLLRELVGTDPQFRTDEVREYLRQLIVGRLGNALATAQVPMLDLAAHQDAIGDRVTGVLTEELMPLGIEIAKFIIENISLPPAVEEALDKRTQMGIVGDLDKYTKFQTANAIEDAAQNPGGGMGEGLGLGLGMAAGQRMAQGLSPQAGAPPATAPPAGPPPQPHQEQWFIGADVSQDHLAPGFEYFVVRKGVDTAVYEAIQQEVDGAFEAGVHTLGIAEGDVGFEDPNGRVPADVMAQVEEWQAKIIDGSVVPPSTDDEYAAFEGGAASPAASPAG